MSKNQMTASQFYFSFEGRINRQLYWVNFVLMVVVPVYIVAGIIDGAMGAGIQGIFLNIIAPLILLWPGLATQVKRWHDRNKSGWWVLINLIPIIGWIWALIEVGFLPGTKGNNRFGSDPLGHSEI